MTARAESIAEWLRRDLTMRSRGDVTVLDRPDQTVPEGGVVVTLLDSWTDTQVTELNLRARAGGATVVPLRHDGSLSLLGPVIGAGLPGCLACAEGERRSARGLELDDPDRLAFGGTPAPAMLPLLVALIVDVGNDPVASAGTLWAIRGSDMTVSAHTVRPGSDGCAACGPVPDDEPQTARLVMAPRPLPESGELRQPNPATHGDGLRDELVDWRLGPVDHVFRTEGLVLPLVTANFGEYGRREMGHGRAVSVADAERIALFEAVERRAGMRPRGRRTVLSASFAELGAERAIDPVKLGLHDERFYDHPAFRLTPYRPDQPTRWVHGWSLTQNRARAVPEHVAYWGIDATSDAPRFLYETSNGCGLGNSLEEAALYGLLEVAERDAFLMAWYAQTPLRRIAPPSSDQVVPHLVDHLEAVGYDLMLFDASNDFHVPAVVALALHRDSRSDLPQAVLAAGAHPDASRAVRSAAVEASAAVSVQIDAHRRSLDHLDRDRLIAMLGDPTLVRTINDHFSLHTLPEARSRIDFLLRYADDAIDQRDVWPYRAAAPCDLTRLLTDLVERLANRGMETVVVDQSDPGVRARLGLHAVKVIVPGSLPMTFGHVYHRTRGLRRLLETPAQLGRLPAVLEYTDLPLHPHPFP